jgi:mannose-6-phosphate isomerase
VKPLELPPNQFHRFYRGGARIDAFRGVPAGEDGRPEDWVGSAATTLGEEHEGLSRLDDGRLLRDLLEAEPEAFLGREHVERWGADPAMLVKLLDAGERLPVHFHPGRPFAREHLGLAYGKTEAWLILEAEPDAAVHVGLREPLEAETVLGWVEAQDAEEMLAPMNRVPVAAGDAVFVPAGTLHAIGAGILLLELQEPTDLSVLLEWKRFGVDTGAEHLGLGWEAAIASMDRGAMDPSELLSSNDRLLPPSADPYFRADRVSAGAQLDPSFAILVGLEGEGTLSTEHGDELPFGRGSTVLVPHAVGRTTLAGEISAIRCRPPAAATGEGNW